LDQRQSDEQFCYSLVSALFVELGTLLAIVLISWLLLFCLVEECGFFAHMKSRTFPFQLEITLAIVTRVPMIPWAKLSSVPFDTHLNSSVVESTIEPSSGQIPGVEWDEDDI
jgi:hypothetical protein